LLLSSSAALLSISAALFSTSPALFSVLAALLSISAAALLSISAAALLSIPAALLSISANLLTVSAALLTASAALLSTFAALVFSSTIPLSSLSISACSFTSLAMTAILSLDRIFVRNRWYLSVMIIFSSLVAILRGFDVLLSLRQEPCIAIFLASHRLVPFFDRIAFAPFGDLQPRLLLFYCSLRQGRITVDQLVLRGRQSTDSNGDRRTPCSHEHQGSEDPDEIHR
jgi:hypothetical protein